MLRGLLKTGGIFFTAWIMTMGTGGFILAQDESVDPQLLDLEYKSVSDREERVLFRMNGFYAPEISDFTDPIDRIVCDFPKLSLGEGLPRIVTADGTLVRTIRLAEYKGARPKIRVLLDLAEGQDYNVEQIFFEEDNLLALIVKLDDGETFEETAAEGWDSEANTEWESGTNDQWNSETDNEPVPEADALEEEAGASVTDSQADLPRLLNDIQFESISPQEEQVVFVLNGPLVPDMMELPGEPYRVVFDFPETEIGEGIALSTEMDGNFIRRIRLGRHGAPDPKIRVVLDVLSLQDYAIEKEPFPENNRFVVRVRANGAN